MAVAQCVEVDVASQGKTEAEALSLHFEAPIATEFPTLRQLKIETAAAYCDIPRHNSKVAPSWIPARLATRLA